jgi:hypothetical protein
VGDAPSAHALARLVDALSAEGIRFQFAGMTAAILQGAPATTLDIDFWLEWFERQCVKSLKIAKQLGAEILVRTVIALEDDTLVNLLYRMDGLTGAERTSPLIGFRLQRLLPNRSPSI